MRTKSRELSFEGERRNRGWANKIFFAVILFAIGLDCFASKMLGKAISAEAGVLFAVLSISFTIVLYLGDRFHERKGR